MPQVADLRAKISVDGAEKAKSDLKGVHSSVSTLADGFKTGLGAVTGFITGFAGFSLVTDALGFVKDQMLDVVTAAMEQQKVLAQTNAVLQSTHDASGMTAQAIGDLAEHWANLTGISNDSIQSMENILLTFTSIGKDTFPTATQAVLDMATAMHEDLNSAAIQVGKALQDPILGATTLRRVGVQLSQQQIDLIKHFEATGQHAKAQGVILNELTREFGNSAQAAGKTLPGQLAILNEKWDQAKEKIGGAVIPILQSLIDKYLMPAADWLGKHLPAAITTLTSFIDKTLMPSIQGVMDSPVVKTLEGWATAIINKVAPAVGGDNGLSGNANKASGSLKKTNDNANTLANNLAGPFVTKVQKAIDKLDGATTSLGGEAPSGKGLNPAVLRVNANLAKMDAQLDKNAAAQAKAQKATQNSIPVISGIGEKFGQAGDAIGQFVDDINKRLPGALPQIQRIGSFLGDVFGQNGILPGLQTTWEGFWAALTAPVRIAFDNVQGFINVGLDLLQGDWNRANQDAQKAMQKAGKDALDGLIGIGKIVLGPLQAIAGGWASALAHFPELLAPELKKEFDNILPNLEATINNWSHQVQQYINDHMPHFPGISLPGIPGHAAGGPASGTFIGAEEGPELLVTPGVYHAPPGSYVYNAQQTAQMLSGGGGMGGGSGVLARSGDTYHITIVGSNKSASQLFDEFHREADRRRRMHG